MGCLPDTRSGFAVFLRRGAALPAFRRRSQFLVWMARFSAWSAASRMVSVTVAPDILSAITFGTGARNAISAEDLSPSLLMQAGTTGSLQPAAEVIAAEAGPHLIAPSGSGKPKYQSCLSSGLLI